MIRNYTSTVSVTRSVIKIEQRLVSAGARGIIKTYDDDGNLAGICFSILMPDREFSFRLPARVSNVKSVLMRKVKRGRKNTESRITAQAERCAWKNLADWVDVQMTLIELEQASTIEVFMPYIISSDGQQTLFEALSETGFKQIGYAKRQ